MLNILTKTKPWIVASMMIAATVFGQDGSRSSGQKQKGCPTAPCKPKGPCPAPCPQPCPPTQLCPSPAPSPCCPPWPVPVLNAAYNYPARTMTRCPYDVFFDASFLYWQASQENMELGVLNSTAGVLSSGIDAKVLNMDFGFQPAFKVGLGGNFDYDGWDLHSEYTWFYTTQDTSYSVDAGEQIFPAFGTANSTGGGNDNFSEAESKWKLQMNIVEADLGRWQYVGTKFTVRPNMGVRAAFITQKNTLSYNDAITTNTGDNQNIELNTNSWGVGPKLGIDSNWVVGCGFRIFGNAEADILYTRYTKLNQTETHLLTAVKPYTLTQSSLGYLRTHLDIEMGLGWGTYLDCNNFYLDFTAGYGFQVFFDQNMFRFAPNGTAIGKAVNPMGNLYIQGLTLSARLDF